MAILTGQCETCSDPVKRYTTQQDANRRKQRGHLLYCSLTCKKRHDRLTKVTIECKVCSRPFLVSPSMVKRYVTCGDECRRVWKCGERNGRWSGGIATYRAAEVKPALYREWRNGVFERDGHTCVRCPETTELEADHIKAWAAYPELRYEVSNGRTLCRPCHRSILKEALQQIAELKRTGEYRRTLSPAGPYPGVCEECGGQFTSHRFAHVRFCSVRCQRNMGARRLRAVRRATGLCKDCGRPNPQFPKTRCARCTARK